MAKLRRGESRIVVRRVGFRPGFSKNYPDDLYEVTLESDLGIMRDSNRKPVLRRIALRTAEAWVKRLQNLHLDEVPIIVI